MPTNAVEITKKKRFWYKLIYPSKQSRIVSFYLKSINKAIVNRYIKKLPADTLILDFGCGEGFIKKLSKGKNVVGYDCLPEYSDIQDYRSLKPDLIVCSHVLEHLNIHELNSLLDDFKRMNPKAKLAVAFPTETIISGIATSLLSIVSVHVHADHKSKYPSVMKELSKSFDLVEEFNVFLGLTKICYYIPKKAP